MYENGQLIDGVVDALCNFGAFIKLPDDSRGLVHISEVKRGFLKDINDVLKVNDVVIVKVLKFNSEKKKYDLSIKQATKETEREEKKSGPPDFEHKLNQFMKASEDKQVDLRRQLKRKHNIRHKTYG